MKNMITFYNEDYCMDCNTDHSLLIYDIYDNPIPISNIINNINIVDRRELSYIKCKNCKKEYNIDWSSQSRIPSPMITNIGLNSFLQSFKQ